MYFIGDYSWSRSCCKLVEMRSWVTNDVAQAVPTTAIALVLLHIVVLVLRDSPYISQSICNAFQYTSSLLRRFTISYGVIAAQFNLLSESSAKDISKTCVCMFLPALLIHSGISVAFGYWHEVSTYPKWINYSLFFPRGDICLLNRSIVWSIIYNVLSLTLGAAVTQVFELPS